MTFRWPAGPDAAAQFAALQDVPDEANRLARQGQLWSFPALPEVIALLDWAAERVISVLAGQQPMTWPGADAEHFAQNRDQAVREFDYGVRAVVESDRTAIVVDAQIRILGISGPLAAEIGWAVDDLVGRRVVAIVPAAVPGSACRRADTPPEHRRGTRAAGRPPTAGSAR